MAQLNEQQQDKIYDLLIDHGISYEALQMDLLDHLCCLTEEKMDNGLDFAQSLTLSIQEFGLSSLSEIQEATLHLLTLKLTKMKKVVGITGIVSAILVIAGVFFKINHLPGAGLLLLSGLTPISLLIFPAMAYFDTRKGKSSWQKVAAVSGYVAAVLISMATLFRIMHWPGFYALYYPGLILLVFVFLPSFTIKNYKTAENKIMAFSRSLLILAGIVVFWGLLPSYMHPNEAMIIQEKQHMERIHENAH
jgi:cation transport ATPase